MKHTMWYILTCVFVVFVETSVIKQEPFKLDIIHYNDFHDRFEETSIQYPVCKRNDTQCLGGFARLYYEIKSLLKEKPDALVLNAGDTYQGTYWYTLLKWPVTQKFINLIPNDAHALGNHEFDDEVAGLAPYLAGLKAPVLAANMNVTNEPTLAGLFQNHVIVERKGRKIGIFGLITPDTKFLSNSNGVIFADPIETAMKEAEILTNEGVDIIILLSHCGLDVDKKIAQTAGKYVDIIVGGHSHSLLWNGESPSKETISGPYPVVIETKPDTGHKVLVVTASAFSKYLGNLTTYFDENGELLTFDGEPVFLNRSIPEDPEIKTLLQPYKDKLQSIVNEVIAHADADLSAESCGSKECLLGDLIADSFLDLTKERNISNLTHVSFIVRNMIRGSIEKGDITRGSVVNTLPFTNKVMTFQIKGRHLVKAFERCLKTFWAAKPFNGPWMPHVSGARLILDASKARVVTFTVKEGEDYVPISPNNTYQVTTLSFLAKGGNGFKMIGDNAVDMRVLSNDSAAFEKYLKKITPITKVLDNRLTVLN